MGPSTAQALQGGVVPLGALPADAWLAAPPTSPDSSQPKRWIELRLQLGPATSRRHLTCNKHLEMSPTSAPCHSESAPWWPLLSRHSPPRARHCHDFHCPGCVCARTCDGPSSPSGSDPSSESQPHVRSSRRAPGPQGAFFRPRGCHTPRCPLPNSHPTSNLHPSAGSYSTQGRLHLAPPPSFLLLSCGVTEALGQHTPLPMHLPAAHSGAAQPSAALPPGASWDHSWALRSAGRSLAWSIRHVGKCTRGTVG